MRYEVMLEKTDGTLEDADSKFARKRDAIKSARSWAKAMQFLDVTRVHVDVIGEGISVATIAVNHA